MCFLLYCVCMKLIVGDYFEPPTDKPWMCDIWGCHCGVAEDSTHWGCSAFWVGKYVFISQHGIKFWNTVSLNHWVDELAYRIAIFRHFAKLWKVTVSFACLSVHPSFSPSVHMQQLGSHQMDFYEIWYVSIFCKFPEKIQDSLKSDKNNMYFTWKTIYILDRILPSPS